MFDYMLPPRVGEYGTTPHEFTENLKKACDVMPFQCNHNVHLCFLSHSIPLIKYCMPLVKSLEVLELHFFFFRFILFFNKYETFACMYVICILCIAGAPRGQVSWRTGVTVSELLCRQ